MVEQGQRVCGKIETGQTDQSRHLDSMATDQHQKGVH